MTYLTQTNTFSSGWLLLPLPLKMPSRPLLKSLQTVFEECPILRINGRSAGLVYGYRARSQELVLSNGSARFWA